MRVKQPESTVTQEKSHEDQRGTEQSPLIVKVAPVPKTDEQRTEETKERERIANAERKKEESDAKLVEFTGELAWFTKGLFVATSALVVATVALGIAAFFQSRDIKQSLKLARDEFNATHRPKLIVRSFQIGDLDLPKGKQVNFIFNAQNVGDSAATIIEVRSATFVHNAGDPIPTDLSFPFYEPFNVVLKSGERELFPANGGSILVENEPMEIFAGKSALYCMGTIVYVDAGGTRRETGFCRRYRSREVRWEIVESEYEYAY
jgi:hypothetical protein